MLVRKNPKSIRSIKKSRLRDPRHGERQRFNRLFQSRANTSLFREAEKEIRRGGRDEVVSDWKQHSEKQRQERIEKTELETLRLFQAPQINQSPSACDVIENCVRRYRKRKIALEMDRTPDSYRSKISRQSGRNRSPRVAQESSPEKQLASTMCDWSWNTPRDAITSHGQPIMPPLPFFYAVPHGTCYIQEDWAWRLCPWIHRP